MTSRRSLAPAIALAILICQAILEAQYTPRVAVRVYKDPVEWPERYQLVYVETDRGMVRPSAIKQAFPDVDEGSALVIVDTDQAYSALKASLKGRLAATFFLPDTSLPLCLTGRGEGPAWWTFQDATGQPVPGAVVKVYVTIFSKKHATVLLGQMTTDDKGRLPSWSSCLNAGSFTFVLSHPAYGKAKISAPPRHLTSLPVPLVRLDQGPIDGWLTGTVVGPDERPVPDVEVRRWTQPGFEVSVYTGLDGRFAIFLLPNERPSNTSSQLIFAPPRSSGLAGRWAMVPYGLKDTVVKLAPLQTGSFLRRFRFEDANGPITDPNILRTFKLVWQGRDLPGQVEFRYEQFKDGIELGPGMLTLYVIRAGTDYYLSNTILTAEGPKELVFRQPDPLVCIGTAVREDTDEPVSGAYVLFNHPLASKAPSELTAEDWQLLHTQALGEHEPSTQISPQTTLVIQTDQGGRFQIRFVGWTASVPNVTAVAPGYIKSTVFNTGISYRPGQREYQLEILLRPSGFDSKTTFIFEDGSGPVTDDARLDALRIQVRRDTARGNEHTYVLTYRDLESRPFVRGIYTARATWGNKYYEFGPVDLTFGQPGQVVFKPTSIVDLNPQITFTGQVIDGTTGVPMHGALVCSFIPTEAPRQPVLSEAQWQAIHQIGPELDMADPALLPLKAVMPLEKVVRTDLEGRFSISLPSRVDYRRIILALQEGYMPANITIPSQTQTSAVPLRTVGMCPAGTIKIRVLLPEDVSREPGRTEVRAVGHPEPGQSIPWTQGLVHWSGSVFWGTFIEQECDELLLVPAGLDISISLEVLPTVGCGLGWIGPFRVGKGEFLDLGTYRIPNAAPVRVRVLDHIGQPLAGVEVYFQAYHGTPRILGTLTDDGGKATIMLSANLKGQLVASYTDHKTGRRVVQTTPIYLTGPEDLAIEHLIFVPQSFAEGLRSQGN